MKKATSSDVARLAGVSQTTVSMVLNHRAGSNIPPQTRQRILDAAAQLQYRIPSRKNKKKYTIGIMVPTLTNMYYPFLLQQMEAEARARGIHVLIMNIARNGTNEAPFLQHLYDGTVDGILALYTPKTPILPGVPIVTVGESAVEHVACPLNVNSFRAAYILTEHLLERGHRSFAYISTPLRNITGARQLRLDGIRACLANSPFVTQLLPIVDRSENETEHYAYEYECGCRLTKQLLAQNTDVTAIIAVNDATAIGCMNTLQAAGIAIPQQMAVAGFDNLLMAQMVQPKLTSVDQMVGYASKVALDLLICQMDNRQAVLHPVSVEYQPQLFVREST